MHITLINPPVFKVFEPWYDTPPFVRPSIAYLAAYLREHFECEVSLLDCKFERLTFEQAVERVKSLNPDVIGYTAFTNEIKAAAHLTDLINETLPNKPTHIAGGVHVTALPEESVKEFPQFDFIVYGEGEKTLLELCQQLVGEKQFENVPGLAFKNSQGEIVKTDARERIVDINEIPTPAWDLLPPAKHYFIQAARGCPFSCKFCMNPNGKYVRHRTTDDVVDEILMLADEYGAEQITFGDEISTVDMPWSKELFRKMIAAGTPSKIAWNAGTHVRFIDDEICQLMKQSNCSGIGLGIETGSEEQLKKIGKGTTMEMIFAARECTRKAGVWTETFCILGQINETRESLMDTINLIVKLNPELPIFGIMVPYPGTEVARLAARHEGGYKIISTDWNDYNKQIGGAMEFAGLTRSQIEFLQIYAYMKVFIVNRRFKDLFKFCMKYGRAGTLIVLKNIGMVFKSLVGKSPIAKRECEAETVEAIGEAMNEWESWQRDELKRAKKAGRLIEVKDVTNLNASELQ